MIDRIRLSITVFFLKITRIGIIKRPDRDKTVTTILQLYHDDTGIILVPILDVLVIPDDTTYTRANGYFVEWFLMYI